MPPVIVPGDIRSVEDQYTGPSGELRVDESNYNLRLHDGSTPGGRELLSRDNADQRYQAASAELQGFVQLEPQQKGFMVRLGPADYVLRELVVDQNNLVLENANGYEGNPAIGLATQILSSHEWGGDHEFDGGIIVFKNGLVGNLTGDVEGNLTGDVTGNVTGDLTGDADGNHTGSFAGDVDVRGKDLLLDNGQISVSAISGLQQYIKDNGVPVGTIVAWSGAVADIPAGWRLCNGLNGTPNLRNRFILGAGDTYAVGATGGSTSVTPTGSTGSAGAHTHGVTGTAASKATGITVDTPKGGVEGSARQQVANVTVNDPGHNHTVTGTADSQGSHTHTVSINSVSTMSPYYALAFMMKVAS